MRRSTAYLAIPVSLAILGGGEGPPILAPAHAQPVTEEEVDRIRRGNRARRYAEALFENARFFRERRQCDIWRQIMRELRDFGDPTPFERGVWLEYFPPATVDDWADRYFHELELGCEPIVPEEEEPDGETGEPEAEPAEPLPPDAPINQRWSQAAREYAQALADCDSERARAWLERMRALVAERRRIAETAEAAGEFGTVDPDDARRRLEAAQNGLRYAEERFGQCFPRPGGIAPPDGDGGTPGDDDGDSTGDEHRSGEPPDNGAGPDAGGVRDDFPGLNEILERRLRDRWMMNDAEYGFRFSWAYAEFDEGENGIGFRRDGPIGAAPEEFAQRALKGFWFFGGEIAVETVFGTLFGGYQEGDAGSIFDIPAGTAGSGIVYGALSPGGSSGIATPFGLSGDIAIDFSEFEVGGEVDIFGDHGPGGGFDIGLGFSYTASERRYRGFASGTGSVGGPVLQFSQERIQEIEEDYFRIYGHAEAALPAGPLIIYPSGHIGLYYRDSRLGSVERNTNNFALAADQDFTIEIERTDDGIGFRAGAGVTIGLPLSDRFMIGVGGAVEYRSDVGAIFNPNSGDQVFFDGLSTDLSTGDRFDARFSIEARVKLP